MKLLLLAVLMSWSTIAAAGEVSFSCIGAESDDCPMNVDVTLDDERLNVSGYVNLHQPNPDRFVLHWCSAKGTAGTPSYIPAGWRPVDGCYEKGTFRVLNGELSKRQLATANVFFEVRKSLGLCSLPDNKPKCAR